MDRLIERAQKGDSEAFVTLFESHKQELWKTAKVVLGNTADASDVLQETLIKAWQAIPRFEGRSDLSTWLTRILLRSSFDILRKKKQEIPFASISSDEMPSYEGEFYRQNPNEGKILYAKSESVDYDQRIDITHIAEELSKDDRILLIWFYGNDYSVKQIALILKITEGAVRTRLSRARNKFKKIYLQENIPMIEVI